MLTLPIHQLSLYFPYDIEFKIDGKVATLDAITQNGNCKFKHFTERDHGYSYIQPILKSIDQADKYILGEFIKHYSGNDCDMEVIVLFSYEKLGADEPLSELELNKIPHDSFMWMVRNKYDVFGWIATGEAVEVVVYG